MTPPRFRSTSFAIGTRIAFVILLAVVAYFLLRSVRYLPTADQVIDVLGSFFIGKTGISGRVPADFAVAVTWLALAAGLVVLPIAMTLLGRFAVRSPAVARASGRASRRWISRIALIAALAIGVTLAKRVDLTWEHFGASGADLVWYAFGRAVFSAAFAAAWLGLGAWLLGKLPDTGLDVAGRAVLGFFLGATVLAILGVLLGAAGLLNLATAGAVTLVAAWLGAPLVTELAAAWLERLGALARASGRWTRAGALGLAWICLVLGAWIAVSYGLFPYTLDTDVWEHYLHYYREVLNQGSIGPNAVWYHYFLSKGAGLFFLASALTDVFGAQLVTQMMMAATALIIYDVLALALRERTWALLGVLLFAAFLYGRDQSGMFFKHHGMFFAYAAFLCWVVVRLSLQRHGSPLALATVAALCAAYIGFYLPGVALLLLAPMLTIASAAYYLLREPRTARIIGAACIAVAAGAGAVLLLNYSVTGLAEMVPMRFFWRIADQAGFDDVIGTSGMQYFLLTDNHLPGVPQEPVEWFLETLRVGAFSATLSSVVLAIAAAAAIAWSLERRRQARRMFRCAIPFAGLALPAVGLAWVVQIHSVQRLYGFMALILIVLTTWSLWILKASLPGPRWRAVTGWAFLLITGISSALQAIQGAGIRPYMAAGFVLGKVSLEKALITTDRDVLTQIAARRNDFLLFRKRGGKDARILALTYGAGFAYFLPQPGVISEPSYSVGTRFAGFYKADADATARRIKALGIDYVFINLRAPIASGFGFTDLFAPQPLAEQFRLVYEADDTYVLGWADENPNGMPIPFRLIQVLDLKRSGAMHRLLSPGFVGMIRRLAQEVAPARIPDALDWAVDGCWDECKAYVSAVIRRVNHQLAGRFRLKENEKLLDRVRTTVVTSLSENPPYIPGAVPRDPKARLNDATVLANATLESISLAVQSVLARRLGQPVARLLATRDERFPYTIATPDGL